MRPQLTFSLLTVLFGSMVFSCKKEHNTPSGPTEPPAVVYVLGTQTNTVMYWKNGAASAVRSYFTSAHARYWTDEWQPVDLTGKLVYMNANGVYGYPTTTSVYASGNDVYVSGYQATTNKGLPR